MSKDDEIRNVNARRRNIVFLMRRYLLDNGFFNTADALKTEARINGDEFELCDNIDLDAIYLEFASYYHLKFGKYPKILRKAKPCVKVELAAKRKKSTKLSPKETPPPADADSVVATQSELLVVTKIDKEGMPPGDAAPVNEGLARLQEIEHGGGTLDDALYGCQDWQNLVDLVRSTVLREEMRLSWSDMYGNAHAIEIIKEAVLAPLKHPELFRNGLRPWRSVLVHGPPGSGKTQLAKILYAETRGQVNFYNVTSSVIVSKWRGESEKIVKILFSLAQKNAPSVIFLDEIEGLTSKRDRPSDHESSKRFKNELLQLLDGMEQHLFGVFILASTNLPWDIDEAFLRRFEKKLLVELPNEVERAKLIGKLLPITMNVTKEQMELLVRLSEHFTGDEIRLACKEIGMQAVRRLTRAKEMTDMKIERAFEQIKPLSLKLMDKHVKWQAENGS